MSLGGISRCKTLQCTVSFLRLCTRYTLGYLSLLVFTLCMSVSRRWACPKIQFCPLSVTIRSTCTGSSWCERCWIPSTCPFGSEQVDPVKTEAECGERRSCPPYLRMLQLKIKPLKHDAAKISNQVRNST